MKRLLPLFLIAAALGVLRAKHCREHALTPNRTQRVPAAAAGEGSRSVA